jgi:RsiW-degrading membrane proteinase PrsW (M82 family)
MMIFLLQVICAVLPAIVLAYLLYGRGVGVSIPGKKLIGALGWGCLVLIALLIFGGILPRFDGTYMSLFWRSAFPEELLKMLFMLFLIYRYQCKRTLDVLMVCGCVGLGFAFIENVYYVASDESWFLVALVRAISTIPSHFTYAMIMGFFIDKALNHSSELKSKVMYFLFAFSVPVLMHWATNSLILIINPKLDNIFLTLFDVYILPTIFVIFAFKYIKKLRAKTEESTLSNHHSWRQTIDVVLGKIKDL